MFKISVLLDERFLISDRAVTLLYKHDGVSGIHHPLFSFEPPKIAFTRIAIATIVQKRLSPWVGGDVIGAEGTSTEPDSCTPIFKDKPLLRGVDIDVASLAS